MKLWLVRHARPLVAPGVCYGSSDVAADEPETLACARALAELLPPGVNVRHSPLQRCTQLAQALESLRPDLRALADARLVEMDFGCWEGVHWDAIPKAAWDEWMAAFGSCRFGGRESVQELLQRVARARLDTRHQARDALWITHAGVIRALAALAQGREHIAHAQQWPQQALGFGEWLQLEL